jgi:hypothetical protein
MTRRLSRCAGCLVFVAVAAAACGGKSSQYDGTPRSGDGGGTPGGGAAGGSSGGSVGGTSTQACADAGVAVSSMGLPSEVGCYAYATSGWVRVACNCELLIQNPTPVGVEVRVSLTLGSDVTPSLTASPYVEVAFDDPDGSWLTTWAAEAGKVGTFSVIGQGSTTVVRLGAASVSLDAVSLAGCEMRAAEGSLGGLQWPAGLSMQAVLTDGSGNLLSDLGGSCINPPHL